MRIVSAPIAFALLAACHHGHNDPPQTKVPVNTVDAFREAPATTPERVFPIPVPVAVTPAIEDPIRPPLDIDQRIARINGQLQDTFYDYDRAQLNTRGQDALHHDAALLAAISHDFPAIHVVIEGHCDERGSAEYNLALGDHRAASTAAALQELGVSFSKLDTISYGKENPQCTDPTESCWQRNRRAHLVVRK